MTAGPYRTQSEVARTDGSVRCAGCKAVIAREVVCFSSEGHTVCEGCLRLECVTATANEMRLPRYRTWNAGRFLCGLFLCIAGQYLVPGPAYFLFACGGLVVWAILRSLRT